MARWPQTVSLCVAQLPWLPAHSLEQIAHLISENCFPSVAPESIAQIPSRQEVLNHPFCNCFSCTFSCLFHGEMLWLDVSRASPGVSCVPGLPASSRGSPAAASRSYLPLHPAKSTQFPPALCAHTHVHLGAHGGRPVASKMMLYHSPIMRPLLYS